MRRASKVDDNQAQVVAALRAAGATVRLLHAVGDGCPDLLVGYRGLTYLIEVKDGRRPPSERRLTPAQEVWHRTWNGWPVAVVLDIDGALRVIGVLR